jgi:hypothetical protein
MSTSSRFRWGGSAALLSGLLGIVYFPFHAAAYLATAAGAETLENPWIAAWSGTFRSLAGPLLTFAEPDVVYMTYNQVAPFVLLGFLAGLLALHRWQAAGAGGLERWGFRVALVGNVAGILGLLGENYTGAPDFFFLVLSLPGILLYTIGATLLGIGTLRAEVAPRVGAWLLILGGFPGLFVLAFFVVGHFSGGFLLLDIAWIVLGYALWRAGSQQVRTQPEAYQQITH